VWGNGALQWFGEGAAYGSAALVLIATAGMANRYRAAEGAGRTPSTAPEHS
jgi:hypothetical protein